jgi:hypothetical protein
MSASINNVVKAGNPSKKLAKLLGIKKKAGKKPK